MTTDIEEKVFEKIEVLFQGMTEIMQSPISKVEKIEKVLFFAELIIKIKEEYSL
jgi:hypothetical protein